MTTKGVVEPVVHVALVPQPEAESTPPDSAVLMFERLIKDPTVDVEKMERLIAMRERIMRFNAEQAFGVAMADCQKAMRPVAADCTNPQTKSRYASYSALDRALRPIYTDHGFSLSFNSGQASSPDSVLILCKVRHRSGHVEPYQIEMPADGKGAKGGDVMTKTHATGAGLSYGQRYLLKLIFNIAVDADTDGNAATRNAGVPSAAPAGFEDWWTNLTAVAENGLTALEQMWRESNKAPKTKVFCDYASKTKRDDLNALKVKAGRVAAS